jgi:exonuclease III
MLTDFLHKPETDIILLQEVTHNDFDMIRGYNAYTNVGINKRGMAILTRDTIKLTKITRVPSGRGMRALSTVTVCCWYPALSTVTVYCGYPALSTVTVCCWYPALSTQSDAWILRSAL